MITKPTAGRTWLNIVFTLTIITLIGFSFSAATADEEKKTSPEEGTRKVSAEGEGKSPRDGEGTRTGPRDGEGKRTGPRDGEVKRTGPRDGETPRRGARDPEGTREGRRDGDKTSEGKRDGERGAGMTARNLNMWNRIYTTYDKDNSRGVTFEEWVAMKNYELTADQKKREKGWFVQADSNGDTKITLGEWIDWKSNQ